MAQVGESHRPSVAPSEHEGERSTVAAPIVQAFLLGGFRVLVRGRPVPEAAWRRRAIGGQLFKCLLTRPRHRLTRDEAIELFWPEDDPRRAYGTLRAVLTSIRDALRGASGEASDGDIILTDQGVIRLRSDAEIWVDAEAFELVLAEARRAADPAALLEQAEALYRGDYLPDDLYEADWACERREALRQQWVELMLALARLRDRRGDVVPAVETLRRVLRADPCDERAARVLMTLFARRGRRADALKIYNELTRSLHDRLGGDVEPSARTAEVRRQIVAGELAGGAGRPTRPVAPSPPASAASSGRSARPTPGEFVPAYPFPTPERLVGRQHELETLGRVLERRGASGQVAFLAAPAGTGKSTLLGALVARAQRAGLLCLAGGCYEREGVVPLGPVRDALADYLLAQEPRQVEADLGAIAVDLAHAVPELRYHLNVPGTGGGLGLEQARLFGAVGACLRRLSEQQSILLCLEDLHVADAATLDLIRFLGRQIQRLPLVLVCTFRSDEVPPGHPLARLAADMTREGAARLNLAPLDRGDTAELIDMLLRGPASEPLRSTVYSTTEGNPLFVEQLVLTLREEGKVDRRAGVWQQLGDASSTLPTATRALLDRRFERLSSRCHEVLAAAAVLGQSVEHETLLETLGASDEIVVLEGLEDALESQILVETSTGYAFGHTLLREAFYSSLHAPRRMILHASAGAALERLAGSRVNERASELAYHFVHGGQAPAVRARALQYSLLAGRRAAALSSHREAFEHYTQACELIDKANLAVEAAQRLEAVEGRGSAEFALGLWLPLIETCQQMLELTDEPLRRARARGWVGHCRQRIGDTAAATHECDAALAELHVAPTEPGVVVARLRLLTDKAYILFLQGRFGEQLALGSEMLPIALELGQPKPLQWAHNVLALGHMVRGQVEPSLQHFEQARDVALRSNDSLDLAMAFSNLGVVHQYAADFARSRSELERALELCCEMAAEHRAINTIQRLGRALLAEGDLKSALERAEQARELATRAHDRWGADCYDLLGTIFTLKADWSAATAYFEQALQLREHGPHVVGRVQSLLGLGLVRQQSGNWRAARAIYAEALETAGSIEPNTWLVAARRHLGALLAMMGAPDGASILEAAIELSETMPRTSEYGPTLLAAVAAGVWRENATVAIQTLERALAAGLTIEARIETHSALAALLQGLGDAEMARGQALTALDLARRLGAPRTLSIAHRALGLAAAAGGDGAAAAAAFDEALAQAPETGLPYEHARALADYALLPGLEQPRARAMVEQAATIFSRLGVPAGHGEVVARASLVAPRPGFTGWSAGRDVQAP